MPFEIYVVNFDSRLKKKKRKYFRDGKKSEKCSDLRYVLEGTLIRVADGLCEE